jgi:hypothetical protein
MLEKVAFYVWLLGEGHHNIDEPSTVCLCEWSVIPGQKDILPRVPLWAKVCCHITKSTIEAYMSLNCNQWVPLFIIYSPIRLLRSVSKEEEREFPPPHFRKPAQVKYNFHTPPENSHDQEWNFFQTFNLSFSFTCLSPITMQNIFDVKKNDKDYYSILGCVETSSVRPTIHKGISDMRRTDCYLHLHT